MLLFGILLSVADDNGVFEISPKSSCLDSVAAESVALGVDITPCDGGLACEDDSSQLMREITSVMLTNKNLEDIKNIMILKANHKYGTWDPL